jgi:hypothetical protein
MTKLSERKRKASFTTDAEVRYRGRLRAVVIEIENGNGFTATVRLAGTRLRYPFSWRGVHDYAAELYARQERERRKQQRAERARRAAA